MSVPFERGGAHVDGPKTRFRVFASEARACEVRFFDAASKPLVSLPMGRGADGVF
jgi:hypothetical protein